MNGNTLFLLDAWALFYRANFVFASNPRLTSNRFNTSTIYGFINTVLDILTKENPSHLAIAYESKSPTFRHVEYEPYKAHRPAAPESIIESLPYIEKIITAMKIPIYSVEGFEADDVIGTLAWKASDDGFKVYMVTPDKDYGQLVQDHVYMYNPSSDKGKAEGVVKVLDREGIKQKYGIYPEQVVDFLALTGDKSDNIPGIPKVGEKTALQLLEEFGSLKHIIANADKIAKKSIQETVRQNAHLGILSQRLATIRTDVPIDWNSDETAIKPFDLETLRQLFQELEFKTILKRIPGMDGLSSTSQSLFESPKPKPSAEKVAEETENQAEEPTRYATLADVTTDYQLITTEEELSTLIDQLSRQPIFCFDTETTSLNPHQAELVGISIAWETGKAYFIAVPSDRPTAERIISRLKPVFEDEKIEKIAQNIKYDLQILRNYGLENVKGKLHDTMLAHYVCHSNARHNMDTLARHYLAYSPMSYDEMIADPAKSKKVLPIREVQLEKLVAYACEDADITFQLHQKLSQEVTDEGLDKLLYEVEIPLVPVLADMEYYGIRVDDRFLADYSVELGKMIGGMEAEIYTLAGTKFNVNSPKQLGEILFEQLKLGGDKIKKTKTGQYATGEEVLADLAAQGHTLPTKILEYRHLLKLKSTYVDAIPQLIDPKTGRIHTNYNQSVAVTGRLSSNNPNLQNIPIRTDMGKEIRKAFIATNDDYILLSADYSQIELRIMAALSGDDAMLDAFHHGADIHAATASRVFGVPIDEVTSDLRRKAKMVNFGLIYGITSFGLSQRLGISRSEAKQIMDTYFEQYKGIKAFMDQSIEAAREKGYATTLMGRKHYLNDIHSNNPTIRGFAERNAINTPIQGTAADMIKLAMIHTHKQLNDHHLQTKMMLQVHDELLFDVPKSEQAIVEPIIRKAMTEALPLNVPIEVNIGYGTNWLDAH